MPRTSQETLKIFNSNVKSVLLYGAETWRTTKAMLSKIQRFINYCLRKIMNIRWFDKVRNEDLWQRANQDSINIQIKKRKWAWIGHTLRKPPSSITRQAHKAKEVEDNQETPGVGTQSPYWKSRDTTGTRQ